MPKQISATDAKNNFGGLLDDVASLGRVDIVKHGRLVAVVLSPGAIDAGRLTEPARGDCGWSQTHMIPPDMARAARMLGQPRDFDED